MTVTQTGIYDLIWFLKPKEPFLLLFVVDFEISKVPERKKHIYKDSIKPAR